MCSLHLYLEQLGLVTIHVTKHVSLHAGSRGTPNLPSNGLVHACHILATTRVIQSIDPSCPFSSMKGIYFDFLTQHLNQSSFVQIKKYSLTHSYIRTKSTYNIKSLPMLLSSRNAFKSSTSSCRAEMIIFLALLNSSSTEYISS